MPIMTVWVLHPAGRNGTLPAVLDHEFEWSIKGHFRLCSINPSLILMSNMKLDPGGWTIRC